MIGLGNVGRRWVLALFAGAVAAPVARLAGLPALSEPIVLVDGWILRVSDLEKAGIRAV